MKNLPYLFLFFAMSSLFFSSCKSEAIEDVTPAVEETPPHQALAPQTTVLFVANPLRRNTDCMASMGTCGWGNPEGCDIMFDGTVEAGLMFIEEEDTPNALFVIETYEDASLIGFRFKGLSSRFEEESAANGDDGSSFIVEESLSINEEAAGVLGYQNIQIERGQYEMFVDSDTNEKIVYISAVLN